MKINNFRSIVIPLFIIPVGGILILGICYLLYFGVYQFVETLFFLKDPTSVPAGIIRNSYAAALLIFYWALFRTKLSELLKATILIGPMTTILIAAILAFYENITLAIAVIVVITALCIFLLHRFKKPWIYYYATAVTVVAAIAYAWPKA